jgi:CheY-like chemotaxis protein
MDSIRLGVLVVDDERVIADSLALILRSKGHEAHGVCDAEAAISEAAQFAPDAGSRSPFRQLGIDELRFDDLRGAGLDDTKQS